MSTIISKEKARWIAGRWGSGGSALHAFHVGVYEYDRAAEYVREANAWIVTATSLEDQNDLMELREWFNGEAAQYAKGDKMLDKMRRPAFTANIFDAGFCRALLAESCEVPEAAVSAAKDTLTQVAQDCGLTVRGAYLASVGVALARFSTLGPAIAAPSFAAFVIAFTEMEGGEHGG